MKFPILFKTGLLVSCLFVLCTPRNPTNAAGFATSIATTDAAVRTGLTTTAIPAPATVLREALSRYEGLSQKQVPASRKTNFFRRWIHRQMLRLLPDVMDKADKKALWALGMGIGSILLFPLLGPAALYLGISALKDGTTKRTEATIGLILGGLATLLLVLAILLIVLILGGVSWFIL